MIELELDQVECEDESDDGDDDDLFRMACMICALETADEPD